MLRGRLKRNIHDMLQNHKEHKVEAMIADHKQSIQVLSGMKAPAEHQFRRKFEQQLSMTSSPDRSPSKKDTGFLLNQKNL